MTFGTFVLAAAFATLAYLAGSVSSAILVCRVMRLPDPRQAGSGNPGATNVLRIGGKGAAALTLAGDVLKGLLPVLLVALFTEDKATQAVVALAAIIGHILPVFFDFRGGKGVATAFGALFALAFPVGLMTLAVWLASSLATRLSSLSALLAWAMTPLFLLMRGEPVFALASLVIALLIGWTHRGNIQRLRAGTEPRIGQKA